MNFRLPESYQLRHNNHLTIVLEALARDEAFMDVTLTAQGRSLKAHKVGHTYTRSVAHVQAFRVC